MHHRASLATNLRALGLTAGDTVMAHAHWPDRFFARIVDAYLKATPNTGGCVGDARTHVINARDLFDFACPIMELVRDAPAADVLLGPGRPAVDGER